MKLIFIGEIEMEIPKFGVFKPGAEVDYDETLLSTRLFVEKEENEKKAGVK